MLDELICVTQQFATLLSSHLIYAIELPVNYIQMLLFNENLIKLSTHHELRSSEHTNRNRRVILITRMTYNDPRESLRLSSDASQQRHNSQRGSCCLMRT